MKPILSLDMPNVFIINESTEVNLKIVANDSVGEGDNLICTVSNPAAIENIMVYNKVSAEWETKTYEELQEGLNIIIDDSIMNFLFTFSAEGNQSIEFILEAEDVHIKNDFLVSAEEDVEDGTPFMDIYEQFLSCISDDRYALMSQEELMAEFLPLLKRSIYYLCRLAKVPGYNLHARDDEEGKFLQKLTEHEIECLSWGMVVAWVEQQMNSTRFIQQAYYDAGIKTYSPNDTMRNLLTLHDTYYNRLKNKLTEYTFKTVDIYQFGGNE